MRVVDVLQLAVRCLCFLQWAATALWTEAMLCGARVLLFALYCGSGYMKVIYARQQKQGVYINLAAFCTLFDWRRDGSY